MLPRKWSILKTDSEWHFPELFRRKVTLRFRRIAYQNKEVAYGILFQATAETMRTIAVEPQHLGAEIGFFAVLYSWGQTLSITDGV